MYVYLSSNGSVTQIDCAESPSKCRVQKTWDLLMALEVPKQLVTKILSRWKRESRGAESRLKKGLSLAKQFCLRVHVAALPVGILKELMLFRPEVAGTPKPIPSSFWDNI